MVPFSLRRAMVVLLALAGLSPLVVLAQVPPSGRAHLFVLDLAGTPVGEFPTSIKQLKGSLEVAIKDGVPMLKASVSSEFLITLPQALPADFTLEFDLVPKACCAPQDLSFEGTPLINQGAGSAHVLWDSDGYLAIIGGGGTNQYEAPMPEDLRATLPGVLTNVVAVVQGPTIRLYTNGRRHYTLDKQFARGRVLRVFLGVDPGRQDPVYLAGLRISAGATAPTGVAANPAPPPGPVPGAPPTPPPGQPAPAPRPAPAPAPAPTPAPAPVGPGPAGPGVQPTPTPVPPPAPPPPAPVGPPPTGPGGRPTPTPVPPPPTPDPSAILVGTGISDITGPIAGVGMVGYAQMKQVSAGLHTRLYARAFAFGDSRGRRAVFVSADLGMIFSSVKQGVLKLLPATLGYNDQNVMLTATHTHAGPGGYSHHTLYNFYSGFVPENYNLIVQGIAEAILQADLALTTTPANSISMAIGPVPDSAISVNRSIDAFRQNPEILSLLPQLLPPGGPLEPASKSSEPSEMTVLGIRRGGVPVGAISWFPVHPTSLPQHNLLVSADNKGFASFLFERANGTIAPFRNPGGFVAAFPNGAAGDQSPNLTNTPPPPAITEWTGPGGSDPFRSVDSIGTRQFRVANGLFNGPQQTPVTGLIDFRHTFRFMPGMPVNTTKRNGILNNVLCVAAYGEPFGAGTEDGRAGLLEGLGGEARPITPPQLAARAGVTIGALTALIAFLPPQFSAALMPFGAIGTAAMNDPCQLPKPNLIPTGVLKWTPDILPFQLLRLGPVVIAGFPGEMTVQAGRRLQTQITLALAPLGVRRVILTGYANEYNGYVTTPEEYDWQSYEGGSTIFGRLTFEAYLQIFGELADAMAAGLPVPPGPPPPDLGLAPQISLVPDVSGDGLVIGETFGEVLMQPTGTVTRGSNIPVHVTFRSGHPRNDFRRNDTYFLIERDAGGRWVPEAWDAMPETKLYWSPSTLCVPKLVPPPLIPPLPVPCGKDVSQIDVHWNVPPLAPPGQYRVTLFGKWKNGTTGLLTTYQGTTNTFTVQ